MIVWIVLFILFAATQLLLVAGWFPLSYAYVISILILLGGLGVLYRTYAKQRSGEWEDMKRELAELHKNIDEIKKQ